MVASKFSILEPPTPRNIRHTRSCLRTRAAPHVMGQTRLKSTRARGCESLQDCGDGIGREVVPESLRVLEAAGRRYDIAFSWKQFDWSCQTYLKTGRMMPRGRPRPVAQFRCDLPWRGGISRRPGPRFPVGPVDPHPARLPAVCQSAASALAAWRRFANQGLSA